MTPERQQELRELGEKYRHPASSLIGQAADYIEMLESRVSQLNIKNSKMNQQIKSK